MKGSIFFIAAITFYLAADLCGQSIISVKPENLYNLATRGSEEFLIDEPQLAGDPRNGQGGQPVTAFDPGYNRLYNPASIIIDLEQDYRLDELWYYDINGRDTIRVYTGEPGDWHYQGDILTFSFRRWGSFSLGQDSARFLKLVFRWPQAKIAEIVLYGEALGTNLRQLPLAQATAPVAMGDFIGINGFIDDPIDKLARWGATSGSTTAGNGTRAIPTPITPGIPKTRWPSIPVTLRAGISTSIIRN